MTTKERKEFLGIRSATKEESAIYEKVENILNHSMTKTESNLFYDLIDMEELSHLLRNKIKNKCLQELLSKYNITAEEVFVLGSL